MSSVGAKPREVKLEIALPASLLSTEHTLELKTIKAGIVGRYCAVFRVDHVNIYIDEPGAWRDAELLKKILEYMVVAPYLRKKIFPPSVPELRYAGILPPLQLPTHGVGGPKIGEIREALVVSKRANSVIVDAGLNKTVRVTIEDLGTQVNRGDRVLVKIESLEPPRLSIAKKREVYSGFTISVHQSLSSIIKRYRNRALLVATSRRGQVVTFELLKEIAEKARSKGHIVVLFGAPDKGLYEIASSEGFNLDENVDYVINTVPNQGTLTVRTEEALAITLASLNLALP